MANLAAFVVRRCLATIVLAFVIITITFFLVHLSPFDPVSALLGQHGTYQNRRYYRHLFGLDQPLWRQYLNYMWGLLHGNLGNAEEVSYFGDPVWSLLQSRVSVTMLLGGYALVLALLIGLPVGLISALKQNTIVDHAGQSITVILYVIPAFVLVPVCQLIFGDVLGWLPVADWGSTGFTFLGLIPNSGSGVETSLKEAILPVVIYAAGLAGFFAKSFRSFLLEILRQDYVRTARAKGLKNRVIIYLHVIKNTLVPLASIIGPTVSYLIVGAFIIEDLFGIPGIAQITATSVENSDYAVVQATTLILVLIVIGVNLLTDIFYAMVDPRIRL